MVLQKRIAKEEIQMQISLLLMQQIAQLFLILLMGYAVVKTGLLKASDSKVPVSYTHLAASLHSYTRRFSFLPTTAFFFTPL